MALYTPADKIFNSKSEGLGVKAKFYNDLEVSPNSIVTLIQTKLFPLRKIHFKNNLHSAPLP